MVHFDKAGDVNIDIDLYYFQTEKIIELLTDTDILGKLFPKI